VRQRRLQGSLAGIVTLTVAVLVLVMVSQGVLDVLRLRAMQQDVSGGMQRAVVLMREMDAADQDYLTLDDQGNMWVGLIPQGLGAQDAELTLRQARTAERGLNRGLAALSRQALPRGGAPLVEDLRRNVATYERLWASTQRFAATDPAESAHLMYVGNEDVSLATQRDFAALARLLGAAERSAVRQEQAAAAQARVVLGVEGILVLALGALAVLTVRRALRPVPQLTRAIEEIAAGRLEAEIDPTTRSDEIGRLARATTVLRGRLRLASFEQRQRAEELGRLVEYNALLADLSRIAGSAPDEAALLREVCAVAQRRANVALVWIGVPDQGGHVVIAAGAGRTEYLEGLPVSAREDVPEGQGMFGRAWRSQAAQYAGSIAEHPDTGPWRERAARVGVTGVVSLPIRRGGRPYGVWSFYVADGQQFGPDVRLVFEEMARTVGWGLDRLDAAAREEELGRVQTMLLDQTDAGIALARNERLVAVNRRLVEMLGLGGPEDLIGRPVRALYASDEEYGRAQVGEAGPGEVSNVRLARRDGRELVGDVTLSVRRVQGAETVVWTAHDVTARFELERLLAEQAYHDHLTGLPNRRALDVELEAAVARAQAGGAALVVGLLNLDDFGAVNDTFGREAGDMALRSFADRLKAHLAPGEFLARVGGDDFAVLLEGYERPFASWALRGALSRLHKAVEEPLEPVAGEPFSLEMSLGLAVCPDDGPDGPELLRRADAALTDLKAHKHDRRHFWRLASAPPEESRVVEEDVEAYDGGAADLLSDVQGFLAEATQEFIGALHRQAGSAEADSPSAAAALLERHAPMLEQYLSFLLHPATTRAAALDRAAQIGEQCALAGLDAAGLTWATALYREILTARLNRTLMSSRPRYRLLLLAERRLLDSMARELRAMQDVTAAYFDALAGPLSDGRGQWVDAVRGELEALGGLPGVVAVLVLRLRADGLVTVEHSAGPAGGAAEELLRRPRARRQLERDSGERPGTSIAAWRGGEIVSVASYRDDPRFAGWRQEAESLGIRSMLSVPVLDDDGHFAAGICLFGRCENQFEPLAMRQFAKSVEKRWEELWRLASRPAGASPVPQDVARARRERLFGGGLRMWVQPVVDLEAGRVARVEALARLAEEGRILLPGEFLPLLGDAELARLFRAGLDQALGHLEAWRRGGLDIGISVNLPPRTLLIPECPQWVARSLELLETTLVDEAERDRAIARLSELGVQLAIDDLGAGYSSLRRLSALPYGTVKVDQGLLSRLREEPLTTLAVVDAVIELGRRLGREVVVEGLEDLGLIETAAVLGAQYGQGFELGRPMPAEVLRDWLGHFSLPIEPGAVHTYLGALTYLWKRGPDLGAAQCPLTHFLAERGAEAAQAAEQHRRLHGEVGDALLQDLFSWLLARAQEEGRTL